MNDHDAVLARFRASTGVAGWAGCLAELLDPEPAGQRAPAEQARTERLAAAVCVAVYLEWLAWLSDDPAASARAGEQMAQLREQVLAAGPADRPATQLCWFPLLVRDGYQVHAERLLEELANNDPQDRRTPELLVLRYQNRDVRTLAGLRGLVRGRQPTTFLPAVFEYGHALVNVGAAEEAARLLDGGPWDLDDPFLRDVRGSIGERLGEWTDALRAYAGSRWPGHRYRAAVVGTIAGQPELIGALRLDEQVRKVMSQTEGDLSPSDMARSMAFLNACLWHPIVSWMLELELGKLSFRRRRFAEADTHFQRALAGAPQEASPAIATLRFFNLTWLTENAPHAPLTLQPEALAAGRAALDLGGEDDPTIRTWLASSTKDLSLIPASLDDWSAADRAAAYQALGDTARAVDATLESLHTAFYHRPAIDLVRWLHDADLVGAAVRLATIVRTESEQNFLALWETGQLLQQLRPAGGGADTMDELASEFLQKVMKRSQFEFMNALRARELVQQAGYEDLAEELLLQAAKLAENVSELVAVAVLRRTQARTPHSDREGLACLDRAHRIARDRRDRLEIAREYCQYGALPEGRAILLAERVFDAGIPLSHSEMIATLQCEQGCTPDERRDLVTRAAGQLNADLRAETLGPYPRWYGKRLLETLLTRNSEWLWQLAFEQLARELIYDPPEVPWGGAEQGGSPAVDELLNEIINDAAEPAAGWYAGLPGTGSFGLRLLLVTHLRGKLAAAQQAAREAQPSLPAEQIPIAKAVDGGVGQRTIQLCDLWRTRLTPGSPVTDELDRFFATEEQLLQQWDVQRSVAGAEHLRSVLRLGRMLRTALEKLLTAEQRADPHPVLRSVFEAAERDITAATSDVAQQVRTARRRLVGSGPAQPAAAAPSAQDTR